MKAQKKQKVGGGFRRAYWRFSYNLLNRHMGRQYQRFSSLQDKIRMSGIRLTYEVYLCGMFLTSAIIGVAALAVGGVVLSLLHFSTVGAVGLGIFFGIAGAGVSFFIQFLIPRFRASGRKRRIDEDLAFVVSRMAVLSASGMTPEAAIRAIAEDDSNDLIIKEFRKIVRDQTLLGMDLSHALQEARRRSPSDTFAAFLDGMIATANSGADIESYLMKQSKTLMNDKRLKVKAFSESLGVVAEMYTTLLVVMPLILIILFAVMGVIVGNLGGLSITLLIQLVVYVMIPFGGIIVLVIADSIMPRR